MFYLAFLAGSTIVVIHSVLLLTSSVTAFCETFKICRGILWEYWAVWCSGHLLHLLGEVRAYYKKSMVRTVTVEAHRLLTFDRHLVLTARRELRDKRVTGHKCQVRNNAF